MRSHEFEVCDPPTKIVVRGFLVQNRKNVEGAIPSYPAVQKSFPFSAFSRCKVILFCFCGGQNTERKQVQRKDYLGYKLFFWDTR